MRDYFIQLPNKLRSFLSQWIMKRLNARVRHYERRFINNMDHLRLELKVGDVVLVEGHSELSRIIKVLTQSSWSHAAFYVGDRLPGGNRYIDDADEGSSQDRNHMLIEADGEKGVIAVPLSKYQEHNIRICRPFGITDQDLQLVVTEVIGNLGKRYDHRNILDLGLMLLPPPINPWKRTTIKACLGGCTPYEVICSGMIASAFQNVGYPIIPVLQAGEQRHDADSNDPYGSKLVMRHYSQIFPRDFDLSPNFEIVKYNIIRLGKFDYKSLWSESQPLSTIT